MTTVVGILPSHVFTFNVLPLEWEFCRTGRRTRHRSLPLPYSTCWCESFRGITGSLKKVPSQTPDSVPSQTKDVVTKKTSMVSSRWSPSPVTLEHKGSFPFFRRNTGHVLVLGSTCLWGCDLKSDADVSVSIWSGVVGERDPKRVGISSGNGAGLERSENGNWSTGQTEFRQIPVH